MATLHEILNTRTRAGAPELVESIDPPSHGGSSSAVAGKTRLRCLACGHRCPIPEGAMGVCKVRFNEGGRLKVPWGYVGGVQCDPVEKKPFFHAYPGALAYSLGMLGCDLHCSYCQNWVTSQALRDPDAVAPPQDTTPASLVQDALRQGAKIMVSTYNEPLITVEWAVAIFKLAREQGLVTGFVSNGNGTERVLEYLRPHIDLYKVDLKSFDDRHYRELGGRLQPILDTIQWLHRAGVWVEIVTLLIPGFNDSDTELKGLTEFLVGVSPDIPWHVTAYHQDYRMNDHPNTTPAMLERAARIGREAGLRYIYAGNLPGRVGDLEHTDCHECGERLIARYGYLIRAYNVTPDGACPRCAAAVPGRWSASFEGQRAAFPFLPQDRTRLTVIEGQKSEVRGQRSEVRGQRSEVRGQRSENQGWCDLRPPTPDIIPTVILDSHHRPLRNLRLSVTDRCNLRCSYCMPEADYVWLPREDILHFEEVERLVDVFTDLGVDKVRLTGGEPLLRRDVTDLVRRLALRPAVRDLAMTTNGVLLGAQATALKAAGLHRLTVSLDTLRRDRFQALTRFDEIDRVLEGISLAAPLFPGLKLDTVVIRGVNDDELIELIEFARTHKAEVRFIEYMDVGGATHWSKERVLSRGEMLQRLEAHYGTIEPIVEHSSAPADRYRLPDGDVFGIISSTTEPFCHACDRSRLTADGLWYLCLYATHGTDLRRPLRGGATDDQLAQLIRATWEVRSDRGAEERLASRDRSPLIPVDRLRRDPHLEMHTRGG